MHFCWFIWSTRRFPCCVGGRDISSKNIITKRKKSDSVSFWSVFLSEAISKLGWKSDSAHLWASILPSYIGGKSILKLIYWLVSNHGWSTREKAQLSTIVEACRIHILPSSQTNCVTSESKHIVLIKCMYLLTCIVSYRELKKVNVM